MKTNFQIKQMFLSHFRAAARRIRGAGLNFLTIPWEHPTSYIERPTSNPQPKGDHWMFGVGRWMFDVFFQFQGSKRKLFQGILALCLFGFLLPARGQGDPRITNTNYPMNTNVSLEATVMFRLYATSTNPPITYQWQHEGTNLPAATNGILLLTNLTLAHAGGYMVWITNAIGGYTNTRTAILTVDPTFTKITQGRPATDQEGSTSATWIDYDQDGWLDLFVGNADSNNGNILNSLYRNNGDGTFTKIATNFLGSVAGNAFGVAWGDYDNDGRVDLYVANLGITLANRLPSVV